MPRLKVISGPHPGSILDVKDGAVIGRSRSADLQLDERTVSRQHARLLTVDGQWQIVDLGSSNGTFVTFHGEPEMVVRREEVLLHGRGSISFGHPYSADPTEVAAFDVEALS